MGRRAKKGIDRTRSAGMGRRKLSYVRHHAQMIGSSIIKNDAYAINDEVRYLKGKLLDQRTRRAPTIGDFLPNLQQTTPPRAPPLSKRRSPRDRSR